MYAAKKVKSLNYLIAVTLIFCQRVKRILYTRNEIIVQRKLNYLSIEIATFLDASVLHIINRDFYTDASKRRSVIVY